MRAIVLAAGWSTRMGYPKALTLVGGAPAVARIVASCREAACDTTVVAPPGVALPPLDARIVVNPDPDAGRTGSLQLALRGGEAHAVLVWPVDHPLATVATAKRLLATPGEWVVPEHAGRGGHPIVLRARALAAVRTASPATPLRDALREARLAPARLPVEDAGVLANLDSPADLQREGI